jgi:hypothetical protein
MRVATADGAFTRNPFDGRRIRCLFNCHRLFFMETVAFWRGSAGASDVPC